MGILIRKQEGFPVFTGIARLALIAFIVSFGFAFINTIWALYLDSFVDSMVFVGLISAALTLISFLSYFLFIPIIEKSNKAKLYSYSLLAFSIAYILFAINTKFYFFIILAFFITIIQTFRVTSFGIIVRDKSSKRQLSRNEGFMYTFMNVAWVLGPLIAGFISKKYGFNLVFILSAIFIFLAFLLFKISKINDTNIKKKIDGNIIKNFIDFFREKNRVLAYILSGGVDFWWSFVYLFMPLFIIRQGLGIEWVGYFLFAVAFPLILFQYKFSKLTGKIGFKKFFKIGYFIPFILVFFCFFIGNVFIILGLFILSSIGLAMLESTTEAYFLDILKKDEECRFYGPYNTTINVNGFFGKSFPALILIFLPFKFIFLFLSFFMFAMFLISFKIKEVIENKG